MYDNKEEQQCRLNKCVIILTTPTSGFILLVSLFSMNSNSQIILRQASAALDIKQSEGMQVSAAISSDTNQLMKSAGLGDGPATTNATTNIVLVHGFWVDGSSWSKVIPILEGAGHRVIAVQLALHSLADDVATVKRAIALAGGPTVLVGHSYDGIVITNAAYNNKNVTGLVYVTALAPDEGQSLGDFFDIAKLPKGFLISDSGGFLYINST